MKHSRFIAKPHYPAEAALTVEEHVFAALNVVLPEPQYQAPAVLDMARANRDAVKRKWSHGKALANGLGRELWYDKVEVTNQQEVESSGRRQSSSELQNG